MRFVTLCLAACLSLSACAPSSEALRQDSERQEKVEAYRELVASGVPPGEAANIVYGGVRDSTQAAAVSPTLASIESREARRARADSLLALPPGTMSPDEAQWIALYYAEENRATTNRAADNQERTSQAVGLYVGMVVALAVVGGILGLFVFNAES